MFKRKMLSSSKINRDKKKLRKNTKFRDIMQ